MRQLSPESRAAFIAGNRFESTFPDAGKRVGFKLLTGDDERKLPALQRAAPDRFPSAVLAYRVLDIEGVDPKDKRARPPEPLEGARHGDRRHPGVADGSLCWRQHDGSGLALSLGDALELSVADLDWLLERIGEQRTREARELEKATKRM